MTRRPSKTLHLRAAPVLLRSDKILRALKSAADSTKQDDWGDRNKERDRIVQGFRMARDVVTNMAARERKGPRAERFTRAQRNALASCYWLPCPECSETAPMIRGVGVPAAGFGRFHRRGCVHYRNTRPKLRREP